MTDEENNELHQVADSVTEEYEEYAHQAWHAGNEIGLDVGQLIMAGALAQDLAERIHNVVHDDNWMTEAESQDIANAHVLLEGASVILHRRFNTGWREQFRMLASLLQDVANNLDSIREKEDEDE